MAKRKLKPVNNVRAMPKKQLRLEGDHLYQWARMIFQLQQGQATLKEFGAMCLQERGLAANHIITDDGFILTQEEFLSHQAEAGTPQSDAAESSPEEPSPD